MSTGTRAAFPTPNARSIGMSGESVAARLAGRRRRRPYGDEPAFARFRCAGNAQTCLDRREGARSRGPNHANAPCRLRAAYLCGTLSRACAACIGPDTPDHVQPRGESEPARAFGAAHRRKAGCAAGLHSRYRSLLSGNSHCVRNAAEVSASTQRAAFAGLRECKAESARCEAIADVAGCGDQSADREGSVSYTVRPPGE